MVHLKKKYRVQIWKFCVQWIIHPNVQCNPTVLIINTHSMLQPPFNITYQFLECSMNGLFFSQVAIVERNLLTTGKINYSWSAIVWGCKIKFPQNCHKLHTCYWKKRNCYRRCQGTLMFFSSPAYSFFLRTHIIFDVDFATQIFCSLSDLFIFYSFTHW